MWFLGERDLVHGRRPGHAYDANGNTPFDALDRLTVQTDLWGLSTTLAYDAAGRATQVNDGLGGVTTHANAGAVTFTLAGPVSLHTLASSLHRRFLEVSEICARMVLDSRS
jgi:uncharacterized protein RhaS with RHS repeats